MAGAVHGNHSRAGRQEFDHRCVEGPSAEVINQHRAPLIRADAVGECGRDRLGDQVATVQGRDASSSSRRLPLSGTEVGRHRHDRHQLVHGNAEFFRRSLHERTQDDR